MKGAGALAALPLLASCDSPLAFQLAIDGGGGGMPGITAPGAPGGIRSTGGGAPNGYGAPGGNTKPGGAPGGGGGRAMFGTAPFGAPTIIGGIVGGIAGAAKGNMAGA